MIPYLKAKNVAGLIIAKRKPDGGQEVEGHEANEDAGLEACAEDCIRAMHAKDAKAFASALRAAFEVMESEPHKEGGESYDEMNAKAAKAE